jgi:tRNA/rRNA methyltransferase
MTAGVHLNNLAIVLHRPSYPENIGAAARAACNMGIEKLVVVAPRDPDPQRIRKMATHAAGHVIDRMQVFDDLPAALADYRHVVGTTARTGGQRHALCSPSRMAASLVPISRENPVAILFGPEDRGLSNEDIRLCHTLVNIPTASFSSINLAQAVMILCWEIYTAGPGSETEFVPRMACRHELDGMYEQVKDILVRIGYIQPDNPDYWMNRIRHFFTRIQLRAAEVSIIRGICRQIDWYGKKNFRDGRQTTASSAVPPGGCRREGNPGG